MTDHASCYRCINTGCFGVSNAIAKTSSSIGIFVQQVRESRSDFDIITSELHSLGGVIELLKDDASSFPPQLAKKTPAVLETCLAILNELEGCVSVLDRSSASQVDKTSRWVASRDHIAKLRWTLEGYKYTLGLAVDLVALYVLVFIALKSAPRKGEINEMLTSPLPEAVLGRSSRTEVESFQRTTEASRWKRQR